MAWQQPKTNWDTHPKAIEPADLNRIEGNILAVREQNNMALRLEVVDSFPSHTAGRAIYHTGNKMAYVSDGSSWMPFAAYDRGAMVFTPTIDDQTIPEGYHNGQGKVEGLRGKQLFEQAVASDNIKISANAEHYTASSEQIVKRIRLQRSGTYRVFFDGKSNSDFYNTFVRLYLNGDQFFFMNFSNADDPLNYVTYIIEELEVINPDSILEASIRGFVGHSRAYIKNLQIGYDVYTHTYPLSDGDEVILN